MPHFATAMFGVDVGTHSATSVFTSLFVEEQFAGAGITQVGTIRTCLVYHIELKTWAVGVEVGEMERIAMTKPCGIQQTAIIVNSGRTIGYLVTSVTIRSATANP